MQADKLPLSGHRSERARASDGHQAQLAVQRQRVFAILLWSLIAVEWILWYYDSPEWLLFVVPIGWLGILLHNNALLILHELWELNDQLAGRKDEFTNIVGRNLER
jgi:hypothetical protein